MEFPFEQGPEQETGAPNQDIWGFNPESSSGLPGADASLDDLLALYQAPAEGGSSPFASLGEPEAYPAFPEFTTGAPAFGEGDLGFGGFETAGQDTPFPDFTSAGSGDFLAPNGEEFSGFGTQNAPFDTDPVSADSVLGVSSDEDPFAMPGAPVFPPMMETEGSDLLQPAPVDEDPFAMPGAPVFPPMMETESSDLLQPAPVDEDPFAMPGAPVFPAVMEAESSDLPQAAPVDEDPFAMPGAPVFPAVMEAESNDLPQAAPVDEDPFAMPGAPVFPAVMEAESNDLPQAAPVDGDPFAVPGAPVVAALVEEAEPPSKTVSPEPVLEQVLAVPVATPDVQPETPRAPTSAPVYSANSAVLDPSVAHEVVLRSAEERKQLHAQVDEIVKTLNHQLDEVQTNLAFLYSELQKAAVRRAPVGDIMGITEQISHSRKRVGNDSEAYKQAQYLRQVADAYMALMQEL